MNALAWLALAAILAGLVWAALSFDRIVDRVIVGTAALIGRKAGIVAGSAFLAVASVAIAWSSLAGWWS